MNYDLRNHYPYEVNYESKFTDNLTGNVAIIISAISGIAFYTLFDSSFHNGFLIFTMIAGSIYSVLLAFLAFIPLKNLKTHLSVMLFTIVLSFLVPFSNAMASAISFKESKEIPSLIMTILNTIYCLYIFIMMMNPKLNKWAELKEVKSPDGTIKYVRPKYFILAFMEWSLILSSPILMILTVLTKIFIY